MARGTKDWHRAVEVFVEVPGTTVVTAGVAKTDVGVYTQVTINNTATLIKAANENRIAIAIKNIAAADIYIGFNNSVTVNNGVKLEEGDGVRSISYTGALYAIVAAGTGKVAYMEL